MPQTGLSTCQGSGSCYLQFAPSRTCRLPAVKARRLPGEVGQSRPRADSERLVIFTFVFKRGFAPFHPFASFSLPARSVALGYNLHGNFSLQRSRHKFAGVDRVCAWVCSRGPLLDAGNLVFTPFVQEDLYPRPNHSESEHVHGFVKPQVMQLKINQELK